MPVIDQQQKYTGRSAFTILELIVVIVVVAILSALVLPAIMRSRGKARRVQCLSNMRQIGVAFQSFSSQNGYLPNSGTFKSARELFGGSAGRLGFGNALILGAPLQSWAADLLPFIERDEILVHWDTNKPFYDPGWAPGVIPPDGQPAPDSNAVLSQTPIALYACPADDTGVPDKGNLSYAVNGGFTPFWDRPCNGWDRGKGTWLDWDGNGVGGPGCPQAISQNQSDRLLHGDKWAAANLGLLFPGTRRHSSQQDVRRRLSQIRDGSANTILLAENFHTGYSVYWWDWGGGLAVDSSWANPDPRFAAFRASDDVCPSGDCTKIHWEMANSDEARDNPLGAPEKINGLNDPGPRRGLEVIGSYGMIWPYASSRHPGGVNVVFCDGHASFLNEEVDGMVYSQLMSPSASLLKQTWPAYQPILSENRR